MLFNAAHGLFTAHFHYRFTVDRRPTTVATLHRGRCVGRSKDLGDSGPPCQTDSLVIAAISAPKGRPFRRDRARAEALAKCMKRLGLNKDERKPLWAAYFAQIKGPVLRRCIGVITTCEVGHRHRVEAIRPRLEEATTASGRRVYAVPYPDDVFFPSARERCGFPADDGFACEKPTLERKHRYLYEVTLPVGRAARRRGAVSRANRTIVDDDIPF